MQCMYICYTVVLCRPSGTLKNQTGKLKSSYMIQSACVTAIRQELPCLVDKLMQAIIIDYMLGIFRHCRLSEIREFLKKNDRNVKKGAKSFDLILMKQKPNFPAGFSAQNATRKNIPNCNLNELFVS